MTNTTTTKPLRRIVALLAAGLIAGTTAVTVYVSVAPSADDSGVQYEARKAGGKQEEF